MVIGISDRCRTFHLVATIIVSQQTETVYSMALQAFSRVYIAVTGDRLAVRYVMGDAEDARLNALRTVLGSNFIFLMCYFHVLLNAQKRLKVMTDEVAKIVRKDIYEMHFSRSASELEELKVEALERWKEMPEAVGFASYFDEQWLKGSYQNWQCFWHAPGFATTNNPVEQFNRVLNQHYSLHRKLKMGALIKLLLQCARDVAETNKVFRDDVEATPSLKRRVRELADKGLLTENTTDNDHSMDGVVFVRAKPAPVVFVPSRKRNEEYILVSAQLGANYSRMERLGQPANGWPVLLKEKWCSCRYFWKFGVCVHLLFAQTQSKSVDSVGMQLLFDRAPARKGRKTASAGRPSNSGYSLSMD